MKKAASVKKSGSSKKGAFSSTFYDPKSGTNRRGANAKTFAIKIGDILGGKTKMSRAIQRGVDPNDFLKKKQTKLKKSRIRKLKKGY